MRHSRHVRIEDRDVVLAADNAGAGQSPWQLNPDQAAKAVAIGDHFGLKARLQRRHDARNLFISFNEKPYSNRHDYVDPTPAKSPSQLANEKNKSRIAGIFAAVPAFFMGLSSGINTWVACLAFGMQPWLALLIGVCGFFPNLTLNFKPLVNLILNWRLWKGLTTAQGVAMAVGVVFVVATSLAVGALGMKSAFALFTGAVFGFSTPVGWAFAGVLGVFAIVCTMGLLTSTLANLLRMKPVLEPVYENGKLKRDEKGNVVKQPKLDADGRPIMRNELTKFLPWLTRLFSLNISKQTVLANRHKPWIQRYYRIQETQDGIQIRRPLGIRFDVSQEQRKSVPRQVIEKALILLMMVAGVGVTLFATIGTLGTWGHSFTSLLDTWFHASESAAALATNLVIYLAAGLMRGMLVGRRVLGLGVTFGQALGKGAVKAVAKVRHSFRKLGQRIRNTARQRAGQAPLPEIEPEPRERSVHTSAMKRIRSNFIEKTTTTNPETGETIEKSTWTVGRGLLYLGAQFVTVLMVLVNAVGNAILNSQHLDAVEHLMPGVPDVEAEIITAFSAGGQSGGLVTVSAVKFTDNAFEWGKQSREADAAAYKVAEAKLRDGRVESRIERYQASQQPSVYATLFSQRGTSRDVARTEQSATEHSARQLGSHAVLPGAFSTAG